MRIVARGRRHAASDEMAMCRYLDLTLMLRAGFRVQQSCCRCCRQPTALGQKPATLPAFCTSHCRCCCPNLKVQESAYSLGVSCSWDPGPEVDVGHPGFDNAFLVDSGDPIASCWAPGKESHTISHFDYDFLSHRGKATMTCLRWSQLDAFVLKGVWPAFICFASCQEHAQ